MVGDQLPISIAEIAELCYSKNLYQLASNSTPSSSFIFLIFGQKKLCFYRWPIIDSSEFMYATQWKPYDSSLFGSYIIILNIRLLTFYSKIKRLLYCSHPFGFFIN